MKRLLTVVLLILLHYGGAQGASTARAHRNLVLTQATSQQWTLQYTGALRSGGTIRIGRASYLHYVGDADTAAGPGAPSVPVECVGLGVPRGAILDVALQNPVYETFTNKLLAPAPSFRVDDNGDATPVYSVDPSAYARDAWFPVHEVSIAPVYTYRSQSIATIKVMPVQYNPSTRTVRHLVRATIVVKLTGTKSVPSAPAGADRLNEPVYKGLVANYEQAKQWRSSALAKVAAAEEDSTGSWFDPSLTYVRMGIVHDGWYRVAKSTLQALGVSPDLGTAQVMQSGKELPAVVEGDSVISFYARRQRGDSTYYDFYTDTSVVWLSWGHTSQKRYASVASSSSPARTVTSATAVIHIEQNVDYYVGTGQVQIVNTFDVPGEGWLWKYFYPGTSATYAVAVDNIDWTATSSIQLRSRLYGTTASANLSTPDHIASFGLNDSTLGQVSFSGRDGVWPSFTVPLSVLKEGANTINLTSVATSTSVNQFYLDWFELEYPRNLVAVQDTLLFTIAAVPSTPSTHIRLRGFSTADVLILDSAGTRLIAPDSSIAESGGTYTVTFNDTLTVARTYVAVSRAANRPVASLQAKQFKNIRSYSGADYVVVTHSLFLSAANTLAAARKSARSIRTQVVDVQDLYDEFNFGIKNPSAIKGFLYYAYVNWTSPAPSNVVLMGNASWDPHHYKSTSVEEDYVPSFGVPSSDARFVCFDTAQTWIPSMNIGRLSASSATEASAIVSKLLTFDNVAKGEWVKKFLFMTAGDDSTEKASFNALCNNLISTYVAPAPIGGKSFPVYKTSPSYVDGSLKDSLLSIINGGVEMISFIGHSGGHYWGLDPGPPSGFSNTNGWWPFVASVSCNVGAFAEPSGTVLAEDFLLADNRGGVGAWASASLGYPSHGSLMVGYFLDLMRGGERDLGALTTSARLELWQNLGNDFVTIAHQYLTPLIGDPLTALPLPVEPDIAVQASDISTKPAAPTTSDSVVSTTVLVRNFGVVSSDSTYLTVKDTYGGTSTAVVTALGVTPVYYTDSVVVQWRPGGKGGQHTLGITVALPDSDAEFSKTNNTASFDCYVATNAIHVLKPIDGQVVPPGAVRLRVAAPAGVSTTGTSYYFQCDSVASFDSPFLTSSSAVSPSAVYGEWTTPSLPTGIDLYWRARTVSSTEMGNWMTAGCITSVDTPSTPLIRWKQHRASQFAEGTLSSITASDSGAGITRNDATTFLCRSIGDLETMGPPAYYSIIQAGDDVSIGYWWDTGDSYLATRVSATDGSHVPASFNVQADSTQADSMAAFINATPAGDYLGIVAMRYGKTNVNEALYSAIESLGSTKIRSVVDGQAWALIAQKNNTAAAIEALSDDTVRISTVIPTFYRSVGTMASPALSIPVQWKTFKWEASIPSSATSIKGYMLGVRKSGTIDTLRTFTTDSSSFDLSSLSTSRSIYGSVKFLATLKTSDASITPRLKSWSADLVPTAELAVSDVDAGGDVVVPRGTAVKVPLQIYNLGYRSTDSVQIAVSVYDAQNVLQPLLTTTTGRIGVDSSRSLSVPIATDDLASRVVMALTVSPLDSAGDLYEGNNTATFSCTVTGTPQGTVELVADGEGLMEGDYVAAQPKITVRPRESSSTSAATWSRSLLVDGAAVAGYSSEVSEALAPTLSVGHHVLTGLLLRTSANGVADTIKTTLGVNVAAETRILDLFNFPNPFRDATEISFNLVGSRAPERTVLRIYTVAGRKIKEMVLGEGQVQIGHQRIFWDGRDNDGDDVGNGIYFYQLQVLSNGNSETAIGKMVRVR